MKKGYLLLLLHAHLPFVRHPEYEVFLEERWFFEALTETYLPLIDIFDRLLAEGVRFELTMSVSPTLASMLADPVLQERYLRHLTKLIELAQKEIERTGSDRRFNAVARHYHGHFLRALEIFEKRYGRNLLNAFRKFLEAGVLEVLTCGGTHGYLPLMRTVMPSVRAQIRAATEHYESVFGRRPRGIWLPECGYYPGDDGVLRENGLEYFFIDSHGILHGTPRPKYGVFAPVVTPSGVAALARDPESSKQVWSAHEGYPGDFWYREFYRDIGFDLDFNYIRPYIDPTGARVNTGIKYYRITGPTDQKEPYDPVRASSKAEEHAGNFMFNRERQAEYLYERLGQRPLIVAPYDAELFGHWWYEGPQFLEHLIRKVARHSESLELATAPRYLKENPRLQPQTPSYSSWGYKGYSEVWLEGANDWIYRHLHKASERMHESARQRPDAEGLARRALNQMARELLLAESSDWAFMMKTRTTDEYAVRQTREHLLAFLELERSLREGRLDEGLVGRLENRDPIFPRIDYRWYA